MGNGGSFQEKKTHLTVRRMAYPLSNWLDISFGGLDHHTHPRLGQLFNRNRTHHEK